MKYTNYILNGRPLRPETFIAESQGLRQITILAVLPAAVIGVFILLGLLPGAIVMDTTRTIRYKHHLHKKVLRKKRYAECVIRSLGHQPTKHTVQLLMAA